MKRRSFLSVISAAILAPFLPKFSGAAAAVKAELPTDLNRALTPDPSFSPVREKRDTDFPAVAMIRITAQALGGGKYIGTVVDFIVGATANVDGVRDFSCPDNKAVLVCNADESQKGEHVLSVGDLVLAMRWGNADREITYITIAGRGCC